jgi:hypothetical protein
MTPAELVDQLWEHYLYDESVDVIGEDVDRQRWWSRSWLLKECARAQRQAYQRRDLRHVYDEDTAAICQIAVEYGVRSYALDSRILRIDSARFDDQTGRLRHESIAQWGQRNPGWRDITGESSAFAIQGRTLYLERTPQTSATLYLGVWRMPLQDPGANDEFEWPGEHEPLAYWVAHQAFLRPSSETHDMDRARLYREMFDSEFGPEVPARVRADLLAAPDSISFGPAVQRRDPDSDCNARW